MVEQVKHTEVGRGLIEHTMRNGLIEPCLPSPANAPPSGPGWLHEIKHDGFRILALRDAGGVRLYTRIGNDFRRAMWFYRRPRPRANGNANGRTNGRAKYGRP
jgi:hypothetical protein